MNRELDQSERRVYLSGVEQVFVGVMFTGVLLESVSTDQREEAWFEMLTCDRLCRNYGGILSVGFGMLDTRLEENGKIIQQSYNITYFTRVGIFLIIRLFFLTQARHSHTLTLPPAILENLVRCLVAFLPQVLESDGQVGT